MRLDLEHILLSPIVDPPWIIQDFLPEGAFIVLAGDAGVGKSFLSYTMAMAIAGGLPFLGLQTRPRRVVYWDQENSIHDYWTYLQWCWRGVGRPAIQLIKENLRVEARSLTKDWRNEIARSVEEYDPGAVFIDTVTPALDIKDENDNGEASRALQDLRRIQGIGGGRRSFVLLKHAKFTGDDHARRTIRGAKDWIGSTDATYFHILSRGVKRKNGLRLTKLVPEKYRAFGLGGILKINPQWVEMDGKGLELLPEWEIDDSPDI